MSTGAKLEPRLIPIMMMKVVAAMIMIMSRIMLMKAMLPFWCHALAQRNGGKVSQNDADDGDAAFWDHALAQKNGDKVSQKKVWKGREWRREGGVRKKEKARCHA